MNRLELLLQRVGLLILVIASGAVVKDAIAQSASPQQTDIRNSLEVELAGTVADGFVEGTIQDRQLYLLGFSYRRLLVRNDNVAVRYTFEAIPLAALREPFILNDCAFVGTNKCVAVQAPRDFPLLTHRRTSYGTGAAPAGIEFSFLPTRRVQPFFGIRGGFLYFNRNVLNVFASQFNFIIDGRVGVRIPLSSGRDISIAYMFQHLSNAGISDANPGLDSHMITLSYSFRWPFARKSR